MNAAGGPARLSGLLYGAAIVLSPAVNRNWVDAMFAELPVVDGRLQRLGWMLGVTRLVAAGFQQRAADALRLGMHWYTLLALFALVSLAGGVTDPQALGVDDDVMLALGTGASGLLIVLALRYLRRMFRTPAAASNGPG